ncbi:MAG: Fur family transcriptional regulator [Planctomycetota bacterium]
MKEKKIKMTFQRLKILELMEKSGMHFSPESLYSLAKKDNYNVSLASIYRTIKLLHKNGIVEEHDFLKTYKFYEIMLGKEHHDHLICTRCGSVMEFSNKAIEELQQLIAKSFNFTITFHVHKIYGFCKDCAASDSR